MPSGRRTPNETINYCPDTFHDMYRIDANSKFHDYEPDALPERLDSLTEFANRLGFRSIQDAALADAELSSTDKGSRERLLAFAEAGCREKLIDVFNLHCGNL